MTDSYKIIESIGYGTSATAFKIQIGSKFYVIRRQKIYKKEIEYYNKTFEILNDKNTKINHELSNEDLFRSIYFNKFINTINKNHFAIIYKYEIGISNFKQKLTESCKNNFQQFKKYNETFDSKYSFDIIMDLKDGLIRDLIPKLNKKELYSMIIQIIYALNLMHINGYYHLDVNNGNTCYTKTKIKTLDILGYRVPTFGYLYSLIDYSDIRNVQFQLKNDNELKSLIENLNNYKYNDNMKFFSDTVFNGEIEKLKLLLKIISKDKSVLLDPNISKLILSYKEIKYFIKYASNAHKIIRYFYKLIQK
jgi:hypothetical protein